MTTSSRRYSRERSIASISCIDAFITLCSQIQVSYSWCRGSARRRQRRPSGSSAGYIRVAGTVRVREMDLSRLTATQTNNKASMHGTYGGYPSGLPTLAGVSVLSKSLRLKYRDASGTLEAVARGKQCERSRKVSD